MGFWAGVAEYFKDADQRRHEREMYLQRLKDTQISQRLPQMIEWAQGRREAADRLKGIETYWSNRLQDVPEQVRIGIVNQFKDNFEAEEKARTLVEAVESREDMRMIDKPLVDFLNFYESNKREGEEEEAYWARVAYSVVSDPDGNINMSDTTANFLDPAKEYSAEDWELFLATPVHRDNPEVQLSPNFGVFDKPDEVNLAEGDRITNAVYSDLSARLGYELERLDGWLKKYPKNTLTTEDDRAQYDQYAAEFEALKAIARREPNSLDEKSVIIGEIYNMGDRYSGLVERSATNIAKNFNIPNPWIAPGLAGLNRPTPVTTRGGQAVELSKDQPDYLPGRDRPRIRRPEVSEQPIVSRPVPSDITFQPNSVITPSEMIYDTYEEAHTRVTALQNSGVNVRVTFTPDGRYKVVQK